MKIMGVSPESLWKFIRSVSGFHGLAPDEYASVEKSAQLRERANSANFSPLDNFCNKVSPSIRGI
jgi:hypothetical protein